MSNMFDFNMKTNYLEETKSLLGRRIDSLGGNISPSIHDYLHAKFRDYLVWLDSLYEALEEKTITGLPDSLEGKCEQEGTPTPTNPVPINITTGEQVVSVVGKNLFDKDNANILSGYYLNFNQDKIISGSGTATLFISIKGGETYTISKILSSRFAIATTSTYPANNVSVIDKKQNNSATSLTLTTSSSANYLCVFFLHSSDTLTEQQILDSIQIEKGDQATTYEEYKGQDYEINLGKNLYYITPQTVNGVTLSYSSDGAIVLNGTSTANFTAIRTSVNIIGTTTLSVSNDTTQANTYVRTRDTNLALLSSITLNSTSTTPVTKTGTIGALEITIGASGITFNDFKIYVQLEKGSVATSYTPYKTPIYLGEIGTYQDYIFKNTTENPLYDSNLEEGQWYIHKEIGKVVLNGSENWVIDNTYSRYSLTGYITDYMINQRTTAITNYYRYGDTTQDGYFALSGANNVLFLHFPTTSTDTVALFKTWLSSNNVEVYYVLNTPTNTLIEDEELINQLNEIEIFTVISEDFYN